MAKLEMVCNVETSVYLKIVKRYFFSCFLKVANILTRMFKLNHFHFPVFVPFFLFNFIFTIASYFQSSDEKKIRKIKGKKKKE